MTSLENRTESVQLTSQVELSCQAQGQPPPKTSWYKDGQLILNHSDTLEIRETSHKLL